MSDQDSEGPKSPAPDDGVGRGREPAPPLASIQAWLQAVVVHPEGVAAGIASDEAQRWLAVAADECETVVARSRKLTSVERLAIYHNAYFARLLECLRGIYPMIARSLGDEAFDALAAGYLQAHPSRSYTLDRLGDDFANYLHATRPDLDEAGEPTDEWPDFLVDLARLEHAIGEVFDGPGIENQPILGTEQLLAVDPGDWPGLRFRPAPCLRTMAFRFPVNDYFTTLRELSEGTDPPAFPCSEATWLALSRRDYIVRRHRLERSQYELLTALVEGQTIGAAIEQVAADPAVELDLLAAQLREWFRTWTAAGFFVGFVG